VYECYRRPVKEGEEPDDCVCPEKPFDVVLFGIWLMVAVMWILTALRIYFTKVLQVFCHEAFWLASGAQGGDATNSHPCRQNC
jgi:hypothetical protein